MSEISLVLIIIIRRRVSCKTVDLPSSDILTMSIDLLHKKIHAWRHALLSFACSFHYRLQDSKWICKKKVKFIQKVKTKKRFENLKIIELNNTYYLSKKNVPGQR